jgi:ribosome-binding factor A
MRDPHRAERLADEIRMYLATIVSGMGDPRIGLATVTGVRLSPDLHQAHVLVSVLGDERAQQQSIRRLQAAHRYIRHELAQELPLRFTPDLTFELDLGAEYTERVEELLRRAQKEQSRQQE